MARESDHNGIIQETIKAQVAEGITPSRIGLPMRRLALTAEGFDEQQYILLGTPKDLELFVGTHWRIHKWNNPTIADAYRQQDSFLSHLTSDMEVDLVKLRSNFVDGEHFVIGPAAFAGKDGTEVLPEEKRLWAPVTLTLGEEWTLKDLK